MYRTALSALIVATLAAPTLAQARRPNVKKMEDPDLIEQLAASDVDAREDAAEELGRRGRDAAIEPLMRLAISDEESDVYVQAMWAIEEIGGDAGRHALQMIFETPEATEVVRSKVLKKLMGKHLERADNGVPYYLLHYKDNGVAFNAQLLKALMKLERQDMRDLPMLMVRDARLKRRVRVLALDAVEALKHPGAVEAYLALVGDNDKKIKLRCIKGLSRAGLPAELVGPALEEVVRTDKQGDVRAAALAALKFTLYPELLPLVQSLAANERHIMAWSHSVQMLAVLADEGSISTVQRLLGPDMSLPDGHAVQLIQALVRIGNPVVVPALEGHMGRSRSADVIAECRAAIRLPSPEAAAERVTVINTYTPPAALVVYDSSAVSYRGAELTMRIGADGTVVSSDGSSVAAGIGLGGVNANARFGGVHADARVGGVHTNATFGGLGARLDTGLTVRTTDAVVVTEGPCEAGGLVVGQPDGAWYNLYVDGQLRIEARAMDDRMAVGGLEAGTYHVRVNHFMDGDTWSEGRVTIGCGETIKAEVNDGRGLRVLNYPDHYIAQ